MLLCAWMVRATVRNHYRTLGWERGYIDFINACTAIDLSCSKGLVMMIYTLGYSNKWLTDAPVIHVVTIVEQL